MLVFMGLPSEEQWTSMVCMVWVAELQIYSLLKMNYELFQQILKKYVCAVNIKRKWIKQQENNSKLFQQRMVKEK